MSTPAPVNPYGARRRLGEILVEQGVITAAQLEEVLFRQRSTGGRLGELLLESGYVQPIHLIRALAVQYELEFVDLDEVKVDGALAARVPEQLCRRYRALPLRQDGDEVVVAMANPADVFAIDDIRSILRRPIRPVMADPDQIADAIGKASQGDVQVQEAIRAALRDAAPSEEQQQREAARQQVVVTAEEAPMVRFVDLLIGRAVQERASDIHVEPTSAGLRIRFRVDGVLHEVLTPPKTLQSGIISRIKVMAEIDIAERRLPQDGRVTMVVGDRTVDLRVATVPTVYGEAAVLRLLRRTSEASQGRLSDLGMLPEQVSRFQGAYRNPWGAVFVTGPTGSGKTTTLYAALRELNDPSRNIITVEDPVEIRLDGVKQVQVNTKAGLTFASALRSFLRADPDVMLVGEIRDKETATIAIEASLTGHLVLSSVHTNDAASTAMRILEMGVEPFLVTSSMKGVLAQRLARRLCDRCRMAHSLTPDEANVLEIPPPLRNAWGGFDVYRAGSCPSCSGTGYKGRFAIHEMLVMNDDVAHLILHRATSREVREAAISGGMITLREDGLRKVAEGWTSLEELYRVIG